MTEYHAKPAHVWHDAAAGLAAILVGIGFARFAYTVLTPALIANHWFSQGETFYLGATNLAGYLVGALIGRQLGSRVPMPTAIRASMVATVASFIACAWPASFLWFFPWRLLSGISGGAIMVLATSAILARAPAHLRGRVSGIIFGGVGIGITLAGALIPVLARQSLTVVWLALGALSAILTLATWWSWPDEAPAAATTPSREAPARKLFRAIAILIVAYSCDAIGFVPHTVFWIDYIARGLGHGLAIGGAYWVAFGAGAAVGPLLAGIVADRIGLGRGLVAALFVKGSAVALPVFCNSPACLAISSVAVGALTPGIPALISGRVVELMSPSRARHAWAWLTVAFALAQATAAYGLSYLFDRTGSYHLLFAIGGGSLALATILAAISAFQHRR